MQSKRYSYGHDKDGYTYRLEFDGDKEVSRVRTGQRLIWSGKTANLGIKKFKQEARNRKGGNWLIETFKQNAWNNPMMKESITKSALKGSK